MLEANFGGRKLKFGESLNILFVLFLAECHTQFSITISGGFLDEKFKIDCYFIFFAKVIEFNPF